MSALALAVSLLQQYAENKNLPRRNQFLTQTSFDGVTQIIMKKSLLSSFLILAMVTASSLLFVNCTGADGAVGPLALLAQRVRLASLVLLAKLVMPM
ncbi:MAG: hypothetical protein R2822_11345 [Spirosomataceae bacterium]